MIFRTRLGDIDGRVHVGSWLGLRLGLRFGFGLGSRVDRCGRRGCKPDPRRVGVGGNASLVVGAIDVGTAEKLQDGVRRMSVAVIDSARNHGMRRRRLIHEGCRRSRVRSMMAHLQHVHVAGCDSCPDRPRRHRPCNRTSCRRNPSRQLRCFRSSCPKRYAWARRIVRSACRR